MRAPRRGRRGWSWPIPRARRSGPRWRWRRGTFNRSCAWGRFICRRVFGARRRARGGFGDVLTLAEAWGFARGVEARVAAVVAKYDQLGDDCDFLTLAGDWPYRYEVEEGEQPVRGDLRARRFDRAHLGRWPEPARNRAIAPALGLHRADHRRSCGERGPGDGGACSFIRARPFCGTRTQGGTPWSTYTMKSASTQSEPGVARTGRAR